MAPLDAPEGVTRPIVFFDVNIGDHPAGRIKMGTFFLLTTFPARRQLSPCCMVAPPPHSCVQSTEG